ncbi:MAG: hypothetical protein ACRCYZ_04130 [Alphaproteobacteria bacterium]
MSSAKGIQVKKVLLALAVSVSLVACKPANANEVPTVLKKQVAITATYKYCHSNGYLPDTRANAAISVIKNSIHEIKMLSDFYGVEIDAEAEINKRYFEMAENRKGTPEGELKENDLAMCNILFGGDK